MADRPPFDPAKAGFYLIAAILAFQCLIILLTLIWCLAYASELIIGGRFECDKGGRLTELLTGALAAALAFVGGKTRDR
jgi:hypothetical protein